MRQDIRGRRKSESRNTQKQTETFFMNGEWEIIPTRDCNAMQSGFTTRRETSEVWLSNKERRVDALALRADERRDKLR